MANEFEYTELLDIKARAQKIIKEYDDDNGPWNSYCLGEYRAAMKILGLKDEDCKYPYGGAGC